MANDKQSANLWFPAVLTFVLHGLVLLILILFIIKTPLPPYPAGGGPGMEVNLGFSEDGMGDEQPEEYNPNPDPYQKDQSSVSNPQNNDDNVLTQNYEDAVAIKNNPNVKNQTQTTQNTSRPVINEPKVNPMALYSGNSGGSEGETGKPGDQGNPNGDPNAKNHYGEPGNGNRPGNGGNSYALGDRKLVGKLPIPSYIGNEQGKVVVEIFVDRTGKVVKANTGYKGTTTSNQNLKKAAYDAAMNAKFDVKNDALEVQRGVITYIFELQ